MSIGLWVSVIFAVLIGGGGVLYAYIKGENKISGVFIFKLLKIRYNIVRVWNTRLFSFSISIV